MIYTNNPIVSFPKSGRTWLRYGCAMVGLEPEFNHAGHATHALSLGVRFRGIPDELKDKPVIFLHRNPLDTAVSYFFQLIHKDIIPNRKPWLKMEEQGVVVPPTNIDKFVTSKLYGIDLICSYNRAWLDHLATVSGATVLTYEQFHADPKNSFKRLFMALGHPDASAKVAAYETSFPKMQRIQNKGHGDIWRMRQPNKKDPNSSKIRKGKIQGYNDYLHVTTINKCKRIAAVHGFEI